MFASGGVFVPSTPINNRDLFFGRLQQVRTIINAITQVGQHAVMYGERGVGKTSLANVIHSFLPNNAQIVSVKVNCDAGMNFVTLFGQILSEISYEVKKSGIGFVAEETSSVETLQGALDADQITPNSLRRLFAGLGVKVIVVVDEFDRIVDVNTKRLLSDTIKNFSDYGVDTTFIFVGVADSIETLIEGHQSIERALVQVKMPRMSGDELRQIVSAGLRKLAMTSDDAVVNRIVSLSQGLPHYTHLLALHAVQSAVEEDRDNLKSSDLDVAITESISKAQQTVKDGYFKATNSPRGNLYREVLLACALARNDEMGYFSATDIREPLKRVTGKAYQTSAFARHLNEFCDPKRGPVITRIGYPRRYKYRFANPIMEPYVILDGLSRGLIKEEVELPTAAGGGRQEDIAQRTALSAS